MSSSHPYVGLLTADNLVKESQFSQYARNDSSQRGLKIVNRQNCWDLRQGLVKVSIRYSLICFWKHLVGQIENWTPKQPSRPLIKAICVWNAHSFFIKLRLKYMAWYYLVSIPDQKLQSLLKTYKQRKSIKRLLKFISSLKAFGFILNLRWYKPLTISFPCLIKFAPIIIGIFYYAWDENQYTNILLKRI